MPTRQSVKKIGLAPEVGNADDLLNPAVVADWLGVTEQWLGQARAKNIGPRFIKLGEKSIRYRREDVRQWISAKVESAAPSRHGPAWSRRSGNRVTA